MKRNVRHNPAGRSRGLAASALLSAALALALPAAVAGQAAGGGEAFVSQAGSREQASKPAPNPDPVGLTNRQLQERLFRNSPLALQGAASDVLSTLPATGTGNTAVIVQEGSDNEARLDQQGVANRGIIVQQGARNRTSALQEGNDNFLSVALLGLDNAFDLVQRGDGNFYVLGFVGSGLDHSVVQEGSGLVAVQLGVGTLPFSVQQRGQGMEVRIEHNGIAP